MALRRSHFQCGKCEGRRSQSSVARTPSLALPPRWARKEFCVVVCTALLTFVCMLRYWMRNVVPRGLQWNCNEVLDVRCTSAEFCNPCGVQQGAAIYAAYTAEIPQSIRHIQPKFRTPCGIYSRSSAIYIMQQYILQKYTKFRLIHFGSVSNCRYRSIQTQVSFFQHSTIAALYKKGPGVCRGARPCAPLRFSHIPM